MATTSSGNTMCDQVLRRRRRNSYIQWPRRRGHQVRGTRRRVAIGATATGRPAQPGRPDPEDPSRIHVRPEPPDVRPLSSARTTDADRTTDTTCPEPKCRMSDALRTSGPPRATGRPTPTGRPTLRVCSRAFGLVSLSHLPLRGLALYILVS